MKFFKNNVLLIVGAAIIVGTSVFRVFNPFPEFLWIGTIGTLIFILCVVGQSALTELRLVHLAEDVERYRARTEK